MANGTTPNGDASVNYTVKELLQMAQDAADDRHELTLAAIARVDVKVDKVDAKVDKVAKRTEVLEKERENRAVLRGASGKALGIAAAFCVFLINIPATLIALGHFH